MRKRHVDDARYHFYEKMLLGLNGAPLKAEDVARLALQVVSHFFHALLIMHFVWRGNFQCAYCKVHEGVRKLSVSQILKSGGH